MRFGVQGRNLSGFRVQGLKLVPKEKKVDPKDANRAPKEKKVDPKDANRAPNNYKNGLKTFFHIEIRTQTKKNLVPNHVNRDPNTKKCGLLCALFFWGGPTERLLCYSFLNLSPPAPKIAFSPFS